MFLRLLWDCLTRQKRSRAAVFAAVALGTSVVAAMLNVTLDMGDRIARELRAYGANIMVTPKGDSLTVAIGGLDLSDLKGAEYLDEKDIPKIKSEMFWRNNIVGYAPFLPVQASIGGAPVTMVGTWFKHVRDVAPYWKIEGNDLNERDSAGAWVGASLARAKSIHEGQMLQIKAGEKKLSLAVRGILETGGPEDDQIFVNLRLAQEAARLPGKVKSVLISALTTPEDALYQRANQGRKALSAQDTERFACTPYVFNIARDLEGSISNSVASPLRQVAQAEGATYVKLSLLMALVALAALLCACLAVTSAMMAVVLERRREIALLKAIGARRGDILALLLSEALLVGLLSGAAGYALGSLFSAGIGQAVFGRAIGPKAAAGPVIMALACLMAVLGNLLPARQAMRLKPASVLKEGAS